MKEEKERIFFFFFFILLCLQSVIEIKVVVAVKVSADKVVDLRLEQRVVVLELVQRHHILQLQP